MTSRKYRYPALALLTLTLFLGLSLSGWAQEDVKFAPPRPPPMDPEEEFEELEEEAMEMGDGSYRPPPPPPPSSPPPQNIQPRGRGSQAFGQSGSGKLKFHVVEDEFYEKGKKRGRGKKN